MSIIPDLPAADYHDDPGDRPSLSASIAKILVSSSPLHAWTAHPRLNPNFVREEDDKFSIGTVAHAVLPEGVDIFNVVEVCEFSDWRTKAAQEAKAEIRAAGKIPLLGKHLFDVMQMVEAARVQLSVHEADPRPFTDGAAEQTLVWDEAGVLCRARLDWLRDDRAAIDDYKTTSRSASPDSFSRTLFGMGYDIQAAFYLRGLAHAVDGFNSTEFRFVVQETTPPYALSVVSLDPGALSLANDKVEWAINLWRDCVEGDRWPGYSQQTCYAQAPGWSESQWLEKEAREAA